MKSTQKRPLPPTPSTSTKYTNVNDAMQSLLLDTNYENLTDRERKWYNDLSNCHKSIEQKDSTINNLKTIVMEWKKKAIEYESAYKEVVKRLEDREQFLIKQHQAEIEAMAKIQVDQVNDHLEIILHLQKENEMLKSSTESELETTSQQECQKIEQQQQQQLPYSNNSRNDISNSSTSQLCHAAQIANQAVTEAVLSSKEESEELVQRINDMVHAMEGTLHNFKGELYQPIDRISPPPLISDTSSVSSSDDMNHEEEITVIKKKRSIRSGSIPNFLFKNKKKTEPNQEDFNQQKRMNSRNEQLGTQKRPIRTASILSSH